MNEAAARLRLSRSKFYELLLAGDIPSLTIGRSRRIREVDLDAWVADRARAQSPQQVPA